MMVALPNPTLIQVDPHPIHSLNERFPQWTPHLLSFAVPETGDKRGEQHLVSSIRGCLDCPSAGAVLVDVSRWTSDASSPLEAMSRLGLLIGSVRYLGQSTLELKAGEELGEVPWHINSYVLNDESLLADWSALQIVESSLEGGSTGLYRLRTSLHSCERRSFHQLLLSHGARVEDGRLLVPEPLNEKWGPSLDSIEVTIPKNSILLWNEHYVAHNRSMLRAVSRQGSRHIVQAMGTFSTE